MINFLCILAMSTINVSIISDIFFCFYLNILLFYFHHNCLVFWDYECQLFVYLYVCTCQCRRICVCVFLGIQLHSSPISALGGPSVLLIVFCYLWHLCEFLFISVCFVRQPNLVSPNLSFCSLHLSNYSMMFYCCLIFGDLAFICICIYICVCMCVYGYIYVYV